MKLFKKVMAAVLASVLALTVLTGCGSSVNHREMAKLLSDVYQVFGSEYKVEIKEVSTEQADKVIQVIQKVYDEAEDDVKASFDARNAFDDEYDSNGKYEAAAKEKLGINEDTDDMYDVWIAKVTELNGAYSKNHPTAALFGNAKRTTLNGRRYAPSSNGTVSMNTVKFNGIEYLVMVVKIAA